MWRIRALLMLSALLCNFHHTNGQTEPLSFKCTSDTDCEGTTTCSTDGTGTCTCGATPNQGNYNCDSDSATESLTLCTADPATDMCDATNTFWCPDNMAPANCKCKEGFLTLTGDTKGCASDRIQVTCKTLGVAIKIYTYKEIMGKIFFLNIGMSDADTTCALTKDTTDTTLQEFRDTDGTTPIDFLYDGSLADPCNVPAAVDGDNRQIKLYIQKGENYRSSLDLILDITCPTAGDQEPATSVIVTAAAPSLTELIRVASIELNALLYMAALGALETPLDDSANVPAGTATAIIFQFPFNHDGTGNVVTDVFLKDAKMANWDLSLATAPASGTQQQDFVLEYCVEDYIAVRGLTKAEVTLDDGTTEVLRIQLIINMPYFPLVADGFTAGQSSVMITVCVNTGCERDGSLDPCTFTWTDEIVDPTTPLARRKKRDVNERQKRDAEKEIPQNITSVLQFTVQDPNARTSIVVQTGSNDSQQDNCHQTMMFILPLALMGCLLLVSLVLLCFFYSKLRMMMGEQKHGSTNMAYKS